MRQIAKLQEPAILVEKKNEWQAAYESDPSNTTHKTRYRHPDIKDQLRNETASKCVYCESKIGHNTPGDVEHKTPSSIVPGKHFEWHNLTIACTECNRRKNDYFDSEKPFLDPYIDDVERRVVHHGPIVCWVPGDVSAEISVRVLELHDHSRANLIKQKVETIDKINNIVGRIMEGDDLIRDIMRARLRKMGESTEEYSGMVVSICEKYGILQP